MNKLFEIPIYAMDKQTLYKKYQRASNKFRREYAEYLPTPHKARYVWTSGRKTFLYNVMANGTHFYVSNKVENIEIQKRTAKMLNLIIKDHIPKQYFVDKEAFENLNEMVDYRAAMEKELTNAKNEI